MAEIVSDVTRIVNRYRLKVQTLGWSFVGSEVAEAALCRYNYITMDGKIFPSIANRVDFDHETASIGARQTAKFETLGHNGL
jgi:hypothetical protein